MKLDGYIRVSRVAGRGGESFISPEVQREQIEGWARLRGVEVVAWHTDLDQTGGSLVRPGLDAMMERVRSGQTGGVVVAKLDRLSRAGVADALKLVEELMENGGTLAALDLGIDPTTPFGEFALTIMLALARMERRRIAESWDTSRSRAIERGVSIGRAPFGYTRGEDGRLVVDEPAAALVREVFRRRAAGESWGSLAAFLNEHSTTSTGAAWQGATVRQTVDVETYLGVLSSGGFRNEGAHEPLVSRAEWLAAQSVASPAPTKAQDGGPLLSGMARCAGCTYAAQRGKALSRRGPGGRGGQTGRLPVWVYRCKAKHGSGKCPTPVTITTANVDRFVEEAFLEMLGERRYVGAVQSAGYAVAARAREEAATELDAFLADTTGAAALRRVGRYDAALEARVSALEAAEQAEQAAAGEEVSVAALEPQAIIDAWPGWDREQRRTVLRSAIDAVWLRREPRQGAAADRVFISWRGDGTAPPREELPGRGRPGRVRTVDWTEDDPGVLTLEDPADSAV